MQREDRTSSTLTDSLSNSPDCTKSEYLVKHFLNKSHFLFHFLGFAENNNSREGEFLHLDKPSGWSGRLRRYLGAKSQNNIAQKIRSARANVLRAVKIMLPNAAFHRTMPVDSRRRTAK